MSLSVPKEHPLKLEDVPEYVRHAADLLQQWGYGLRLLGVKEVLAWSVDPGDLRVAFRGDALKIETHCLGSRAMLPNQNYQLDMSLQAALGVAPKVTYWGRGQIREISLQTMSDNEVHLSELMSAIGGLIAEVVNLERYSSDYKQSALVTLMPEEGSPWVYGSRKTIFYNARTKTVKYTPKPSWLSPVTIRDVAGNDREVPGADFCQLMPHIEPSPDRPIALRYPDGIYMFLTHSFDLEGRGVSSRDKAKFINRCGGLLFPSLALGHLPAVNFGSVVLVLDPTVALLSMRPYRTSRGRWPVATYATDAWTETMWDFLGQASHVLFQQLTGNWEISVYGQTHMYILGPPVENDSAGVVRSTVQLHGKLKRLQRRWPRDHQIPVINLGSADPHDYPYLETKANGIMSTSCIVACCAPRQEEKKAVAFIRKIKADAVVVLIPTNPDFYAHLVESRDTNAVMTYSWMVHDALVDLADSNGGFWQVQE